MKRDSSHIKIPILNSLDVSKRLFLGLAQFCPVKTVELGSSIIGC